MSDTEPVSEPIDEPVTTNDVESEDDWDLTPAEEPSTATVPEPVAATPPVVPTADVVAHDIPPASPEPVAEVVAEPVVAESKTEAPSVAPVMSRPTVAPTASGTCPLVCSPGLEKLWGWMTWKETTPGVVILTASLATYSLIINGWSISSIFALVLILVVLGGGVVKLHNQFMEPDIPIPQLPNDAMHTVVGQHVEVVVQTSIRLLNAAVKWESPKESVALLSHLWLLYKFSCVLTSPTFLLLVVLAMFIGPMSFEMVKPQLTAVYTTSVKPLVDVAVMKLHKVAMDLHSLDRNRLGLIGAGVVVVLFVIWRMLSSYISLFGVASLLLTVGSLSVVASEHATCCGCPATKKKSE